MEHDATPIPGPTGLGLTRREALKRGAMIAGAAAFVVPVVETISIRPASAQATSAGHNWGANGQGGDGQGGDGQSGDGGGNGQ